MMVNLSIAYLSGCRLALFLLLGHCSLTDGFPREHLLTVLAENPLSLHDEKEIERTQVALWSVPGPPAPLFRCYRFRVARITCFNPRIFD